ncbi:MAG TPA: universal stress protein [Solirubrobacteraceae bacterium]|nr:universal stress protein [Solirubrobacteraceae bacterium]
MKTIIVGYDGTDPAKRALERAVEIAKAFDSKLVITSVGAVTTPAGGRSLGADPQDETPVVLGDLADAKSYLDEHGLAADYIEAVGHPADSIVAAAEDRDADMIVVGTRELGAVQRLLGASVSDGVTRRAHCDVLIVH